MSGFGLLREPGPPMGQCRGGSVCQGRPGRCTAPDVRCSERAGESPGIPWQSGREAGGHRACAARVRCGELSGAKMMLSRRKNASLGNLDFLDKRVRYFADRVESLPNSQRLLSRSAFTLNDLESRHDDLLGRLQRSYGIETGAAGVRVGSDRRRRSPNNENEMSLRRNS